MSHILNTKNLITFLPNTVTTEFHEGSTVLEVALEQKIEIGHSCGGMGSCGTCRVIVKSDISTLPERNEVESIRAEDLNFKINERLACQLQAQPGLVVEVP